MPQSTVRITHLTSRKQKGTSILTFQSITMAWWERQNTATSTSTSLKTKTYIIARAQELKKIKKMGWQCSKKRPLMETLRCKRESAEALPKPSLWSLLRMLTGPALWKMSRIGKGRISGQVVRSSNSESLRPIWGQISIWCGSTLKLTRRTTGKVLSWKRDIYGVSSWEVPVRARWSSSKADWLYVLHYYSIDYYHWLFIIILLSTRERPW